MGSPRIQPETRIGCVHLKVANTECSLGFYRDVLSSEAPRWHGEDLVFLFAGGYRHPIDPNSRTYRNKPLPPCKHARVFHLSILHRERRKPAWVPRMLFDTEYSLGSIFETLYLRDPDDNSVELNGNCPREVRPGDGGANPAIGKQPLDARGILADPVGAASGG